MIPLSLADHIVFALLAFILPAFVVWRPMSVGISIPQDTRIKLTLYWSNSAILWIAALVIFIIWWATGRNFYQLGFHWPVPDSFPHWVLLLLVFIAIYISDVVFAWHGQDNHPAAGILPANRKELLHFASIVSVSAGVCEEVIFRGFFIGYLLALLDGHAAAEVVAIGGSAFVFGVAHAYQGGTALIKITLLSVLFGALFVLTQSLLLLILLHFSIDFCSGLLALIRTEDEKRFQKKRGSFVSRT